MRARCPVDVTLPARPMAWLRCVREFRSKISDQFPKHPEVNISSYPATEVAGLFFFCRAEILNSGGFVQKYSDQGVSCKNIGQ